MFFTNSSREVRKENGLGISSPPCSSITEKSIDELSILAQVPVFRRSSVSPHSFSDALKPFEVCSPKRPPSCLISPMWISPFKNVPDVMITFFAKYVFKRFVFTPLISPSSTISSSANSWIRSKFLVLRTLFLAITLYLSISIWARLPRTAGPFVWLRIRNWIPASSVISPISPPSASSSRTKCPFAKPPIAGLQEVAPTFSASIDMSKVLLPILADAKDASTPA